MKKSKLSKNLIIAIIIVIVMIFLVFGTVSWRNSSKSTPSSAVNDGVSIVDRIISAPMKWVSSTTKTIKDLFNTYEENQQLKQKIDNYASLEAQNESYKDENESLREQLNMNKTLTNYDIVTSSVINRSPSNWDEILIIDGGHNEGIEKGMPVMGNQGLIGRIIQVNNSTSKVQLLTATNSKKSQFPVVIQNGKKSINGLLSGYSKEKNAYIMTVSNTKGLKKEDIKTDAKVTTSGLGGNSPKGLYIGKVMEVKDGSYGLEKKIYIKSPNNLYDINVVTVVKRLATEGDD